VCGRFLDSRSKNYWEGVPSLFPVGCVLARKLRHKYEILLTVVIEFISVMKRWCFLSQRVLVEGYVSSSINFYVVVVVAIIDIISGLLFFWWLRGPMTNGKLFSA